MFSEQVHYGEHCSMTGEHEVATENLGLPGCQPQRDNVVDESSRDVHLGTVCHGDLPAVDSPYLSASNYSEENTFHCDGEMRVA